MSFPSLLFVLKNYWPALTPQVMKSGLKCKINREKLVISCPKIQQCFAGKLQDSSEFSFQQRDYHSRPVRTCFLWKEWLGIQSIYSFPPVSANQWHSFGIFDAGALSGSNAVTFDDSGNMVIKHFISDIDARGHTLTSAIFTNATFSQGITYLSVLNIISFSLS